MPPEGGDVFGAVRSHLERIWPDRPHEEFEWTLGPISRSLPRFRVRRIAASAARDVWVYASVGAWEATPADGTSTEFFLLSPSESPFHVELLAMVANLHADPRHRLDVGSLVDIGRSWIEGSRCDHLLVSLPYPYGPQLERCEVDGRLIRFLWLVPITPGEAALAGSKGVEALERLLEQSGVNPVAAMRPSVA